MKDAKVTRGTGDINTTSEITLTVENKGAEFSGAFSLVPYFIGNDKPEDAYKLIDADNPKTTYVKYDDLSVGAFLRANSTTPVKFIFTPKDEGTYLFLLYDKAQPENEGIWYDLQGRKMVNGKLPKGVYIMNGKKHVVK